MAVQIRDKKLERRIERIAKAKGGISKTAVVAMAVAEYADRHELETPKPTAEQPAPSPSA